MPFTISKIAAEVGDSEKLVERLPHYADRLEATKIIRGIQDDLATLTSHGAAVASKAAHKRVASVPVAVLEVALQYEPDLLLDKRKFFAWLDRHPEYGLYTRKKRRS